MGERPRPRPRPEGGAIRPRRCVLQETGLNADIPERSSRSFWWGFVAGWSAYFGIIVSTGAVAEPGRMWAHIGLALINTLPPALSSYPVALNRRRLLRPEWGMGRTLAVHGIVGLLFAGSTALLALGGMELTGLVSTEMANVPPGLRFVYLLMFGAFMYVIFFGFLMWSESIRRVQESHRLAAREAVLRAEAEAKAVRAQFNPHFVFNTLHSLMLLVRADPAAAERAIEDVATLIRYASIVQRHDIDAVPLTKELEVARRYVGLEQLRLSDRLGVVWQIDVDPEAFTIPTFALQTLVENAIKHGIEPLPAGGHVRIEVREDGADLCIEVRDDGHGADAASVEATPGHGLGLLRRRLEARYGSAGSIDWSTAPGDGFGVSLRLPAEKPGPLPALSVIETRVEPSAAAPVAG